jgi:hypothetical protein
MGLQGGSPLVRSIYMWEGARSGTINPSKPEPHLPFGLHPETLAVRAVLAHRRSAFHPCTCGLRGGAAAMLIAYGGVRLLLGRGRADRFMGRD